MPYRDLEIEIRKLDDESFEAVVRTDSERRGREPFVLPLETDELERVMAVLERRVWRSRIGSPDARELESDPEETEAGAPRIDPEALGTALYDALFRGTNAQVWHDALSAALTPEGGASGERPAGVRLRFLVHRGRADLPGPQALPWEILQRPDTGEHLARCPTTPVVRCLEVADAWRPAPVTGPLRVLLVEASPADETRLETAVEARQIREALEKVPGLEVDHLEHADFESFYRQLRRGGYHVVHFMGHGGFHRETGEPGLVFEGPGGRGEFVPADTFAEHVKLPRSVWLVVLNACSSGALHQGGNRDPFTSAAAALSVLQVPAVVAMQFPISDRAAVVFSEALYGSLAHHDEIDMAVTEGRLAIGRKKAISSGRAGGTLEWVTPVLYLHGQTIRPFEATRDPRADPETKGEIEPLRLGIRSMVGHGVGMEDDADDALDLVEYFDGRYVRDPALWHEEILPRVREFLAEAVATRRPLILDLACHSSLAFAAGSVLEPKSGVDLRVVQRGAKTSLFELSPHPGELWDGPLWLPPRNLDRQEKGCDFAVALSVTYAIAPQVALYLDENELEVRRILDMTVDPEPSSTSVRDGAHALRLAQTLSRAVRDRSPAEWRGTVHLFSAAPNALLVFLGQMAPALGTVQLYEFEFDKPSQKATYWPSFRLPRE